MIWLWQLYYGALAFLVWGFSLAAFFRKTPPEVTTLFVYLAAGLLAGLFKTFVEKRPFKELLGYLKPKNPLYLLAGIAAPLIISLLGSAVAWSLGLLKLDLSLSALRAEAAAAGVSMGPDPWGFFWAKLGASLTVGLLIFGLFALFEELGTRAYGLELLRERFSRRPALAIQAGFWALLFLPIAWLGGYPAAASPTWLAFGWGYGAFLGWLYLRGGLIYPAVSLVLLEIADDAVRYVFTGWPGFSGAQGLFGSILALALGALVVLSEKNEPASGSPRVG